MTRHHYRRAPAGAAALPVVRPPAWQDDAACRGEDPELFFTPGAEARAKLVCAQCPVVDACREYALTTPERYGTWGGLTEDERAAERRRRQRRLREAAA